ncbi:MAG: DUF2206 domain-containing protein [Candidatus Bathyarchaeia archaeon]
MKQKKLPTTFFWLVLVLPLIGVISSYSGNRQLLLAVFLIAALTVFSVIGISEEPTGKTYDHHVMILLLSISLTLLMSQSVASSYPVGADIQQEYNDFSQVLAGGWHPGTGTLYNDVLSVTVFPTVLKIVSGLDGIVIFTIVFPLMFSITPVLLYTLCRRFLSPTGSFFAAFLFLAYHAFYFELIALARQEIAEIFLLLLLLLLLSSKSAGTGARLVSMLVLTIGIVTAHYSIAYVYLFLLVFWYLMGLAFPRTRAVMLEDVGLTMIITVIWFVFLTGGLSFARLVYFIVGINLGDFFSLTSRPVIVSQALGINALSGPLHLLNRMTYYLVNAALGLGFLAALFKRKMNDAERKILPVLAFGVLFIGATVVLPNFSFGLDFTRSYHIGLLLASPCFVYGIIFLNSTIRRLFSALTNVSLRIPTIKTRFITNWRLSAATLLFLFLLFDSGWVWAVSLDNPTSLLLDSERILHNPNPAVIASYYGYYISSEDVAAARWLSPQFGVVRLLCTDYWTRNNVLTSYGGLSRENSPIPTYFLPECNFREGYVFLSVLNTVHGIGISVGGGARKPMSNSTWPISQISSELMSDNMIYSNGGTTIYTYPGRRI